MEIQIAFKEPLNYEFVAGHSKSAAQLLSGVPQLLRYEGTITNDSLVQIRRLQPLDTQAAYGYITTLAIVTYPTDMVPTLALDIKLPNSLLYQDPQPLLYNISQQINSAIGIYLGDGAGDSTSDSSGGSSDSGSSSNDNNGDVFENTSDDDSSSSTKAKVAGIAVGAAALAGAYGGLMFFIARKYKRRQMARARSSSLTQSDSMGRASPAMMGGALMSQDFSNYGAVSGGGGPRTSHGSHGSSNQNSGRTAFISAPVAAENSLGWN